MTIEIKLTERDARMLAHALAAKYAKYKCKPLVKHLPKMIRLLIREAVALQLAKELQESEPTNV